MISGCRPLETGCGVQANKIRDGDVRPVENDQAFVPKSLKCPVYVYRRQAERVSQLLLRQRACEDAIVRKPDKTKAVSMPLTNLTHIARSEGDPTLERKGPSSLTGPDRLARALGWFSIGLGLAELVAPGRIARALGLDDKEGLIRAYGARELASAVPTLSVDKTIGLAARIGGDALDLATLATALHRDNPKRQNAVIATALVAGITLLDVKAYAGVKAAHRRGPDSDRDYADRSGFPRGSQASRGLARRDFDIPADYRAEGTVADALPALAS
jgi:hypothetical protein